MPQRPYTRTLAASAAALALLMAACAPQPAQQATAAAPEGAVPELLQPSVAAAAPEADVAAPGHGVEPDAEQTAETPAVTTTVAAADAADAPVGEEPPELEPVSDDSDPGSEETAAPVAVKPVDEPEPEEQPIPEPEPTVTTVAPEPEPTVTTVASEPEPTVTTVAPEPEPEPGAPEFIVVAEPISEPLSRCAAPGFAGSGRVSVLVGHAGEGIYEPVVTGGTDSCDQIKLWWDAVRQAEGDRIAAGQYPCVYLAAYENDDTRPDWNGDPFMVGCWPEHPTPGEPLDDPEAEAVRLEATKFTKFPPNHRCFPPLAGQVVKAGLVPAV